MAGKGRPPAALTKARKAAREKDAEGYSWALLEYMVDCAREGRRDESLIDSKDAVGLLKTLIIDKKKSKPKAEEESEETDDDLTEWLNATPKKEKTL